MHKMNVFIFGITGLLGSESARALYQDGHKVSGYSLYELPEGLNLPEDIKIHYGDYLKISDDELKALLKGMDALVFATGLDERVLTKPPALETFNRHNLYPLEKILKVAKECGVKRSVILGSYFTYFNETRPELKLAENHPYIQSRLLQKEMAFSFADDNFNVAILELPYVFGVQEGRKPVWTFLIEMIHKMGRNTYYPRGGSAMMTVKQVGEAVRGALLINKGANAYPLGYYNLTWYEMLKIMHQAINMPKRRIIHVPKGIYKLVMARIYKKDLKKGYERGLNLGKFAAMHCSNQFIENLVAKQLGVTPDDIFKAIYDSARLSNEILLRNKEVVEMKITEE